MGNNVPKPITGIQEKSCEGFLLPMMYALLSMLDERQRWNAQFSLHRYIKCGLGICGACYSYPTGEHACVDGPVFYGSELVGSEFGRYRRGAEGQDQGTI